MRRPFCRRFSPARLAKLLAAVLILPAAALAQRADDPTSLTLPSGKVLHFGSPEAKAKFEAGLASAKSKQQQDYNRDEQARQRRRSEQEAEADKALGLQKHALHVFATVEKFAVEGAIVSMEFAFSPNSDGNYKSAGKANGLAYVEKSPGFNPVSGQTVLVTIYECGHATIGDDRYFLCTADPEKAARYYANPDSVKWNGFD